MALKRAVVDPRADHAEDRQSRRHPQLPTTTTLLLVAASCLLGKRAVPSKRRHGFGCGRAGASGTASQHMPHTPAPRPLAPSVTQLPYPRYAHGMARAPRFSHRSPRALTSGVICESVPVYFRRVRAGLRFTSQTILYRSRIRLMFSLWNPASLFCLVEHREEEDGGRSAARGSGGGAARARGAVGAL